MSKKNTHIVLVFFAITTFIGILTQCKKDPVKGWDFYYEAPPMLKIKTTYSVIKNCVPPYPVSFYQQTDNKLGTVKYFWNFGDGTTSTDQNPTHIYSTPGNYTVKFVISNELGSDSAILAMPELSQTSIPIISGFSYTRFNNNTFAPNKIIFKNTSSGANQFYWYFGDGSEGNNEEPIHVFSSPGTYTVKLRGTCTNGSNHEVTQQIFVSPAPTRVFIDSLNLMLPSAYKNSSIFVELWHNANFVGRTRTISPGSYPFKFRKPNDFLNGWYFFENVQFASNEIFKFVILKDNGSEVPATFLYELVVAPVDIKMNFYPRKYLQVENVPPVQDVFIDLYLNY